MTDFVVTITDPAQLEGITWAREVHNRDAQALATYPPDEDGNPTGDPIYLPTMPLCPDDPAYVQFVMVAAAQSYAEQQAAAGAD